MILSRYAICSGVVVLVLFALVGPNGGAAAREEVPRIISLPEVERPRQVCAEHGRVYIVDDRDIVVYSYPDGRFLRKIGRVGQGPGEFKVGPGRLTVLEDRLAVRNMFQVMFFSISGDYIGQLREPSYTGFFPYLPVGKNFVAFPHNRRQDGSFAPAVGCIYDGEGKLLKRFYPALPEFPQAPPPPGSGPPSKKPDALMVREYTDWLVQKGMIFVADSRKGLSISVFDEEGELLYEIVHKGDRVKMTKGFRESVLDERKKSKYAEYDNPVFPEFFPAFIGFKIDGGRIYAITPAQKDGLYEVIEMDLKGNSLKRGFRLPLTPRFDIPEAFALQYDVEDGQFLWVEYNEEKEIHELHIR
ncbi:MAG: 6-bladed beta-propeller [Candidatus Aminicenantes bacterium]|nr:6-bladed beta-propeller [Candidatus Aminicenantes bacterium]